MCGLECQFFFRCPDARQGRKCMYGIDDDDDDEIIERSTY